MSQNWLIGKTNADWQSDRELLGQTLELFKRELQSIREERGKLSTSHIQGEKERADAEASLQGHLCRRGRRIWPASRPAPPLS